MPWRDLLSPAQRFQVMALPASLREYEAFYTLTPADLDFVAAHRNKAVSGLSRIRIRPRNGRSWQGRATRSRGSLRGLVEPIPAGC
jgi:hypothetical protein